jgi:tetratricopeptide (TPR) repeat protein
VSSLLYPNAGGVEDRRRILPGTADCGNITTRYQDSTLMDEHHINRGLHDDFSFIFCYNHQMDIRDRLEKLKRHELNNLASQLRVKKYYKIKKPRLINHIAEKYSEQEIKTALDLKVPIWRRIKSFTSSYGGIITTLGIIVAIIIFVYQQSKQTSDIAKEKKTNEYYQNLLERQELRMRGHPINYINGLGENPLLKHHFEKGQDLSKESRFKQAINEFKKCLSHPKATKSNEVAAHILIGNCYYSLSMITKAKSHYIEALNLSGKVNDKDESLRGKSTALGNIGLIYSDLGKPDEALKYHQDALAIDRKIGYEQGIANQLGNIGLIYSSLGKPDEALKYLKDALAIHRKIGYEQDIASALGNIGLIYIDLGKPDEALKYHQDALAIDRKIGYEQGIANQLGNIGLIYIDLGKPDEALKYLKESLEIFKRIRAIPQVEIASRAIESIEKMKK